MMNSIASTTECTWNLDLESICAAKWPKFGSRNFLPKQAESIEIQAQPMTLPTCYITFHCGRKLAFLIRLQVQCHALPSPPPFSVLTSFSWLHYASYHTLCAGEAEQLSSLSGRSVSPLHYSHKWPVPVSEPGQMTAFAAACMVQVWALAINVSFIGIQAMPVIGFNSWLKFNLGLAVVGIKPCKTIPTLCAGRMCLKYTHTEEQSQARAHRASITQSDYKSTLELASE